MSDTEIGLLLGLCGAFLVFVITLICAIYWYLMCQQSQRKHQRTWDEVKSLRSQTRADKNSEEDRADMARDLKAERASRKKMRQNLLSILDGIPMEHVDTLVGQRAEDMLSKTKVMFPRHA